MTYIFSSSNTVSVPYPDSGCWTGRNTVKSVNCANRVNRVSLYDSIKQPTEPHFHNTMNYHQEASAPIMEPRHHDVLCGRGNRVNFHKGNEYFRKLVSAVRNEYVATPKPEKPDFARLLMHHIRTMNPPGRFLKRASEKDPYVDVGEKLAIDKTSQALREGKPAIEKKIKSGELVIKDFDLTSLINERAKEVYAKVFPEYAAAAGRESSSTCSPLYTNSPASNSMLSHDSSFPYSVTSSQSMVSNTNSYYMNTHGMNASTTSGISHYNYGPQGLSSSMASNTPHNFNPQGMVSRNSNMMSESMVSHNNSFLRNSNMMNGSMDSHFNSLSRNPNMMNGSMVSHNNNVPVYFQTYNNGVSINSNMMNGSMASHNNGVSRNSNMMSESIASHNTGVSINSNMMNGSMVSHNNGVSRNPNMMSGNMGIHNNDISRNSNMMSENMAGQNTSLSHPYNSQRGMMRAIGEVAEDGFIGNHNKFSGDHTQTFNGNPPHGVDMSSNVMNNNPYDMNAQHAMGPPITSMSNGESMTDGTFNSHVTRERHNENFSSPVDGYTKPFSPRSSISEQGMEEFLPDEKQMESTSSENHVDEVSRGKNPSIVKHGNQKSNQQLSGRSSLSSKFGNNRNNSLLSTSMTIVPEYEWRARNSLYLEDAEEREKLKRRRSSVNVLKILQSIDCDSDEDDEATFDRKINELFTSTLARKNTRTGTDDDALRFSMASLSNSLRMSVESSVEAPVRKRAARKRSVRFSILNPRATRMSLTLRQSCFDFLNDDDSDNEDGSDDRYDDRKTQSHATGRESLKLIERKYIPDIFGGQKERRRSSITESSAQLIAAVYGHDAAEKVCIDQNRMSICLQNIVAPVTQEEILEEVNQQKLPGGTFE